MPETLLAAAALAAAVLGPFVLAWYRNSRWRKERQESPDHQDAVWIVGLRDPWKGRPR